MIAVVCSPMERADTYDLANVVDMASLSICDGAHLVVLCLKCLLECLVSTGTSGASSIPRMPILGSDGNC
jgi:hypothetical protein